MSALFLLPLFPVGVYLIIKGYTMIEEEKRRRYYRRLVISRRLRFISKVVDEANSRRVQNVEPPSRQVGWLS